MSGGIAYVYDPDGVLESNLNTELVQPEPLEGEDLEFLENIVNKHRNETGSPVARRILEDWESSAGHFVKVMPRDYKRVLLAIASAEKDGRNVDEAVMEAANG
jgi:glutamate synthase (NADPH/NADH) large chain